MELLILILGTLAEGQQEEININQTSGSSILWLTKMLLTGFS